MSLFEKYSRLFNSKIILLSIKKSKKYKPIFASLKFKSDFTCSLNGILLILVLLRLHSGYIFLYDCIQFHPIPQKVVR